MPVDQGPPSYEVLAALVVSVRGELAEARAELARTVPSDERSSELIDDAVLKPAAVCRWIFTLLGAAPGTRWMTCSRLGCGGPDVGLAGGRTCGCWAGKLARS